MNLLVAFAVAWCVCIKELIAEELADSHHSYRWQLRRSEHGQVIRAQEGPIGDPASSSFVTTLCELVPISPCLNAIGFYVCPAKGRSYCDYSNQYYCPSWGCETIAPLWIEGTGKDPDIKVQWWPENCIPLYPFGSNAVTQNHGLASHQLCQKIQINVTNPRDGKWDYGRTWGLRYYEEGTDRGGLFTIQRYPVQKTPEARGTNKLLKPTPEGQAKK